MRARIVSKSAHETTVELTLRVSFSVCGGNLAAFGIDDDDVPDEKGDFAYIGGCGIKDGQLVVTEDSGLFLDDSKAAPEGNRDLIVAVANAVNAALAGATSPGGKS